MKKISFVYFLFFSLLFIFSALPGKNAFGQNPIPSNNVLVQGQAVFVEGIDISGPTDEKRKICISSTCGNTESSETCDATVYVATTDQQTVLGPYSLPGGETLSVEIDDNQWGVLVVADMPVVISVWIETVQDSPIQPISVPDKRLSTILMFRTPPDQPTSSSISRISDTETIQKKEHVNSNIYPIENKIICSTLSTHSSWLYSIDRKKGVSDYISSKPSYTNKL